MTTFEDIQGAVLYAIDTYTNIDALVSNHPLGLTNGEVETICRHCWITANIPLMLTTLEEDDAISIFMSNISHLRSIPAISPIENRSTAAMTFRAFVCYALEDYFFRQMRVEFRRKYDSQRRRSRGGW